MKNSDHNLVLLNTTFIFLFAVLLSFSLYILENFDIQDHFRYIMIVLYIIIVMICSYYLSGFLLSKFFKTNNLLKLLLKDTLHELNIPLSVIKANTQMLKNRDMSDKDIKKLERINLACDELYKLYEDIDYYIKKETRHEIREAFSLSAMIEEEIEKFKVIYPKTNIVKNVDDMHIFTDKRGFVKVVDNILSNALKYNKNDNDISIYADNNSLVIEDHGIGMSESDLFMIFDRYYQGKNKKSGFGIGLSIVKAFCDEHRIYIKIESKPGIGTKIYLDLDRILSKDSSRD